MTTTTENQTTQAQWNAANRFLDQLLLDQTLTNSYLEISQQANGQDNASEMLTTWLQQQGYDTTPDLVYDALIALQNTSLGYWAGIYGQSFFEGSQPAPVLVIAPNTAGNATPYLNGVELKNYAFESVKTDNIFHPVLSWNLDSNETAGKITFYYTSAVTSGSTLPTGYTGNWFEGTLQTSANTSAQNYHGAIGEPTDENALPTLSLGISGEDIQDWWSNYSTYVYIGIGVVVGTVIIGVLVFRYLPVPEVDFLNEMLQQEQERLRAIEEQNRRLQDPFEQARRLRDPNLSQTIDKWINEVWEEKGMTEDSQRLAFKKIINKAETHFGTESITKAALLKFISEEEQNALDLSKGQYVNEGLDQLISKATGIELEKIAPLLASSGENGLMSNKDWLDLMEQGHNNNYFDNPPEDNAGYKDWLEQVKIQLKEALEKDSVDENQYKPYLTQSLYLEEQFQLSPSTDFQLLKKERHEQYLDNLLQKVKKAERGKLNNMTKAEAETWLLQQGLTIDLDGGDYTDAFLQKMEERKQQREAYSRYLDRLVELAQSKGLSSKMSEQEAVEWILEQGTMVDLIDPDDPYRNKETKKFLEKMKQSEQPKQVGQPVKPHSDTISQPVGTTKIDPKQQIITDNQAKKELIDKAIELDPVKPEEEKKEDPKKLKEVDSKSHEAIHEGYK